MRDIFDKHNDFIEINKEINMAKGRLSLSEKFYIEQHLKSKTPEDVASDLGRTVGVINKHIISLPIQKESKPEPQLSHGLPKLSDLISAKDKNGKKTGVNIMNQAASERQVANLGRGPGGFTKKEYKNKINPRFDGAITKIYDE